MFYLYFRHNAKLARPGQRTKIISLNWEIGKLTRTLRLEIYGQTSLLNVGMHLKQVDLIRFPDLVASCSSLTKVY